MTQKRQLKIQWGKVEMLTRQTKNRETRNYPPPYDQIKQTNTGTVLGKQINMHGGQMQAIRHRIHKAKGAWVLTRENSSRTKTYMGNYEYDVGMRS